MAVGRGIAVTLAIKIAALALIYALFFSPAQRVPPDIAARLTGDAVPR